ncbi:MAG: Hsp20/alpha crystallin family protein [Deferrisomatales bacterium]
MPLIPLGSLRDEVDRLFDELFPERAGRAKHPPRRPEWPWVGPTLGLQERDDAYILTVDLPGVRKDALRVTVHLDSVVLQGETRAQRGFQLGTGVYRERAAAAFRRVVPLPGRVDPDGARARLSGQALTLVLPKAGRRPVRCVPVESD